MRLVKFTASLGSKADAEVRGALRDDLATRSDDVSPPDITFKLLPFMRQSEWDLALGDPIEITLLKRAHRLLAPLNPAWPVTAVTRLGANPTGGGDR